RSDESTSFQTSVSSYGFRAERRSDEGDSTQGKLLGRAGLVGSRLSLACGTRHELATDDGFAHALVSYIDGALHANRGEPPCQHFHLDAQLVAGNNRATEARAFDAGEYHQLVFAIGHFCEQQRAPGLGDGFHHQYPGHDGKPREVTGEKRFIDGNVLERDNALLA